MSLAHLIAMGVIQGLTEFLPVSSSGHLKLYELIYGTHLDPGLTLALEIMLHAGTLLAVLVVYFPRLWDMVLHPVKSDLKWLVLATLPTVVAALLLRNLIDEAAEGNLLGVSFLLTSAVLLVGEAVNKLRQQRHAEVTWKDSLVMGAMQAVAAVLPGLSRSGSTIAGGLASGLNRKRATDFAFLMSVPAVLGALVMTAKDLLEAAQVAEQPLSEYATELVTQLGGAGPLIAGVLASAVFGFIAIRFMLVLVRKVSLRWFSLYTGLVGAIVLTWQILR